MERQRGIEAQTVGGSVGRQSRDDTPCWSGRCPKSSQRYLSLHTDGYKVQLRAATSSPSRYHGLAWKECFPDAPHPIDKRVCQLPHPVEVCTRSLVIWCPTSHYATITISCRIKVPSTTFHLSTILAGAELPLLGIVNTSRNPYR